MKLKCIETSQRPVEGYTLLEKHDIFKMHTLMHTVEYSLMTSVSKVEVRRSFETYKTLLLPILCDDSYKGSSVLNYFLQNPWFSLYTVKMVSWQ